MQAWFISHEFLASWLSAIAGALAVVLTLVSMLRSGRAAGTPFKWNAAVLRIGFLLCLSGILSPTISSEARSTLSMFVAMLEVTLGIQANRE